MSHQKTIVALATAALPAGVAVVRLSGPKAVTAIKKVCPRLGELVPRRAVYTPLVVDGEVVDRGLVVYFPAPHSFTGEDVVEFQGHGGRAVVQAVLDAFLAQPSVRMAEAGEFSRRAFLNGRMDLTAVEGLADLVNAETEAQRRQAMRQLDGELGRRFEDWRQQTLHMLAHVEAAIDFPDEELEVLAEAGLKDRLLMLLADLQIAVATKAGQRVREGFSVVIVGRPNSGKSTFTNIITGKETAIVSPIAGTTRDVVEAHLDVGGYPVVLSDTAGLRDSEDVIEAEGVRRAKARAAGADVVVVLTDANQWPELDAAAIANLRPGCGVVVVSKVDELPNLALPKTVEVNGHPYPVVGVNLTNADALPTVLTVLEQVIASQFAQAREAALLNRERHRAAVGVAMGHLQRALQLYDKPADGVSLSDLMAQDLRDAAAAIGSVTGGTDTEDVLDVVFSSFCIGK